MIDSGLAQPDSFGEMNRRSKVWVDRVYDYVRIVKEVQVAAAA